MVMRTNFYEKSTPTRVLAASSAYTSDQNSTSVDMQGYQQLSFLADFGAAGDTLSGTVYFTLEIEHSDDNSTFVDCVDNEVTNAVTATNTGTVALLDASAKANKIYWFGYRGSKRYVRVVLNATGTMTTGTRVSIYAFQSDATVGPANTQTDIQISSD